MDGALQFRRHLDPDSAELALELGQKLKPVLGRGARLEIAGAFFVFHRVIASPVN